MLKVKKYRLFILALLFLLFILSSPIYIARYKIDRNFIVGNEILLNLNLSNKNKKEDVEKIAKYVVQHFKTPSESLTTEKPIHEMIAQGYGFCDEQASVFLALANYAGIRGRLVFLFGSDSISHHSVAEIFIDKWYMIDPFLEAKLESSFLLPSIHEVILNQKLTNQIHFDTSLIHKFHYQNLFTSQYPYQIIHENFVKYSKTEKTYQSYLLFWMKYVGKNGINVFKRYSN